MRQEDQSLDASRKGIQTAGENPRCPGCDQKYQVGGCIEWFGKQAWSTPFAIKVNHCLFPETHSDLEALT